MFLGVAGNPELTLSQGANCRWSISLVTTQPVTSLARLILTFGRVSEFAPPRFQNILSYTSGWLAALGTAYTRCQKMKW
jgi:hypothetical protein